MNGRLMNWKRKPEQLKVSFISEVLTVSYVSQHPSVPDQFPRMCIHCNIYKQLCAGAGVERKGSNRPFLDNTSFIFT